MDSARRCQSDLQLQLHIHLKNCPLYMRVQLTNRFGHNLWQIDAALHRWGAENCVFSTRDAPNIKEFMPLFRGLKFTPRGGGVSVDINKIHSSDMEKHVKLTPQVSDYNIIHVRGTDYLTHMPQRYQRGREYYQNACDNLGIELSSCHIITDDPSYARHLLPDCTQLAAGSDLEAFQLLAGARILIPSASQFCYWAGYFKGLI